jgi:cytochrome P450
MIHYRQPCPPHSFWWGHLKEMDLVMKEFPDDVHPQVVMARLGEKFDLGPVFYVDLWPIATPMMIIQDNGIAAQITQTKSLPKSTLTKQFLRNMTGEKSIVTSEGAEWKMLRTMFSPGFSPNYLMSLVPDIIVKHIKVFRHRLQQVAIVGETIKLQETAVNATVDVIGEIVMGKNLNSQNKYSSLVENFRRTISWAGSSMDIIARAKSLLPQWWYCRLLDRDIKKVIIERYETRAFDDSGKKTAVDLALRAYQDEKLGSATKSQKGTNVLDDEFMLLAINNIKTILLGGHDTTATTIAYVIFLLSTHPDVLSRVRAEHDSVFTSDLSKTASLISSTPTLLNNLPLTTACIKESLRLFPAGATLRMALPSSPIQTVSHPTTGQPLPLRDHVLWVSHYGIGRRADLWEDPLAFKPDRFLPGHEQPKDAFRSFEKGPRACLGEGLAMLEMKIVLALVCREFEFKAAYAPDAPKADDRFGGQHYQMVAFGPKPAGGMPMRVKMRHVIV